MKKGLQSSHRIKFSDCDPMGHLHNPKYLKYLLDAREDHYETAYGINPLDPVKATGFGWIVVQNKISYFQSAMYNETVICESSVRRHTDCVLETECLMWDAENQHAKAVLWTKFVFSDIALRKSARHPERFIELFRKIVNSEFEGSFDDRVAFFRSCNQEKMKDESRLGDK